MGAHKHIKDKYNNGSWVWLIQWIVQLIIKPGCQELESSPYNKVLKDLSYLNFWLYLDLPLEGDSFPL